MFPLAFIAGWLQGHWWGFISRNYVVWPTFLLMNVFIALKGSHFWFLLVPSNSFLKHISMFPQEREWRDIPKRLDFWKFEWFPIPKSEFLSKSPWMGISISKIFFKNLPIRYQSCVSFVSSPPVGWNCLAVLSKGAPHPRYGRKNFYSSIIVSCFTKIPNFLFII